MTDWDGAGYAHISGLQRAMATASLESVAVAGTERVLDVGCGDGYVTRRLASRVPDGSVLGVDPSPRMIEAARAAYVRRTNVARFDGTSWRRVATPTMAGGGELTDVVALSPSAVVAVGRSNGAPLVLRWNGASWTRETTPGSSNPFVTGAAAGGPTGVWAVGYRFELSVYSNRTLAMLGT